MGLALLGALTFVTLSAPSASADSRVYGYSTEIAGLRVQIYSQMCDGMGKPLHTRLGVKNTSSVPKQLLVHDTYARAVYDPPGPIPPGKGTLVHLTSSKLTPRHTLTLASGGQTQTMTIPESPCTSTTTSTKPHGSTTTTTGKGTTTTSKPPTSSTLPDPPVTNGGGPSDPGVGNNVVSAAGSVPSSGAVKAAATGTLPFTGSDLRTFAVIGNLLVLIGFGMLYLSHRSPKAAALLARLRPGRATSA